MTFRESLKTRSGSSTKTRPVHFSIQIPQGLMCRMDDVGALDIDWSAAAATAIEARLKEAEKALERLRKGR